MVHTLTKTFLRIRGVMPGCIKSRAQVTATNSGRQAPNRFKAQKMTYFWRLMTAFSLRSSSVESRGAFSCPPRMRMHRNWEAVFRGLPGPRIGRSGSRRRTFQWSRSPMTQDHLACLGRHAQVDQSLGEAAADVMGTGEFPAVTGPSILLGDRYCAVTQPSAVAASSRPAMTTGLCRGICR